MRLISLNIISNPQTRSLDSWIRLHVYILLCILHQKSEKLENFKFLKKLWNFSLIFITVYLTFKVKKSPIPCFNAISKIYWLPYPTFTLISNHFWQNKTKCFNTFLGDMKSNDVYYTVWKFENISTFGFKIYTKMSFFTVVQYET